LLGAIVAIFVIAYAAIALEHPIRVNKSASALIGAGLLWTVYAMFTGDRGVVDDQLNEVVSSTAQIVFFLIGAMTIVEVIDAHNGFAVITSLIRTRKQVTLVWLVGFVTFFLSAILDNLTTTIVMISLMRKLLGNQSDRRVIKQLGVEREVLAIVVKCPDILKIALMLREDRGAVFHQAERRL